MTEEDTFSGRVGRYIKVGAVASGVMARFATKRVFGFERDDASDAANLRTALGGLKGPLMKVAQILSTIPDFLPEDYMAELSQLQTNAPSMGWAFVRRRMTSELGPSWMDHFREFDRDAAAAASLGQVHRGIDQEGRLLACKIQYPDMGSAVEADLKQLKLAFSLYRRYDSTIDPVNIHKELSERLREELDYQREGKNLLLYQYMLEKEEGVTVPDLYQNLSTGRLLTMSWLDGDPLMNLLEKDISVRNEVARNMFRAWYVPLYRFGVLHGDPHLGNYTVREDCSLNLLDFGCVRIFRPSFVRAVIDLYKAIRENDTALAVHAYETWGFEGLDKKIIGILNQWAKFLYAPLLEDRVMPIQNSGGIAYGAGVAAKVHRELREIGGVTPPREFVLMDRSAIGLGSVFTRLKAEVNWYQLFHQLIDDFSEDELKVRQDIAIKKFSIES